MPTNFTRRRWIVSFAMLVALGWQVDNASANRPGGGRGDFSRGGGARPGGLSRGVEAGDSARGLADGANIGNRSIGRADGTRSPDGFDGKTNFGDAAQRDLRNRVGLPDEKQLGDFLGLPPARTSANRSTWHEAGANHLANVNERWNAAIADGADRERINNWAENHAERWNELQAWGDGVRDDWSGGAQNYFSDAWWQQNPVGGNWWHYHYGAYRPWSYWWTAPTWGALTAWLAPVGGWGTGCYYDYGAGGNVAYEDDQVTVNDDPVGSTEEFAQSAAELAAVTPPVDTDEAAESQWMALGTYAVSKSFGQTNGSLVAQLAVDREGIVSGALYDRETNQSSVLQGRVDKQTQRIAFNSVDDRDTVYETGIYDLLQPHASVLIHHGPAEAVDVLFVRLETPSRTDQETP